MSDRKAYPSDLTDAEWEILEPLMPDALALPRSQPRGISSGLAGFYSTLGKPPHALASGSCLSVSLQVQTRS